MKINNHTWGIQRWAERRIEESQYWCVNPIPPAGKHDVLPQSILQSQRMCGR